MKLGGCFIAMFKDRRVGHFYTRYTLYAWYAAKSKHQTTYCSALLLQPARGIRTRSSGHSSMGSMETDRWKSLCFCPLGGIGYCIISLHIFIGKVGGCALFQFLLVVLGRFAKTISLKIISLKYTMHG